MILTNGKGVIYTFPSVGTSSTTPFDRDYWYQWQITERKNDFLKTEVKMADEKCEMTYEEFNTFIEVAKKIGLKEIELTKTIHLKLV